MLFFAAPMQGLAANRPTTSPAAASRAKVNPPSTSSASGNAANTTALQVQLGKLDTKVNDQGTEISWIFLFVSIFLGAGALLSGVSFVITDRRAKESHALAIRGETAAQDRSAEVHSGFLENSLKTLTLVNATLELARDASERAAGAIEEKARRELASLDVRAKSLISVVSEDNERALVSNQRSRSQLTSLAAKINGFEINRFILPNDMPLTPHCQFVRGMQFHLEQQFEDAFSSWDYVALDDEAPLDLRSRTWYWIGYEQNNLGEFGKAERSFEKALESASEGRSFELERIRLESRFFKADARQDLQEVIGDVKRLQKKVEDAATEAAARALPKVLGTLGNLYQAAAYREELLGRSAQARDCFRQALKTFDVIQGEKWSLFGRAEALWGLGGSQREEAEILFEGEVRRQAQDEYLNRAEPRTKVLARFTEMICCVRSPTLRKEVDGMYQNVVEALGQVDERMTVYSQIQRRNVSKDVLRDDLDDLRNQATGESESLQGH